MTMCGGALAVSVVEGSSGGMTVSKSMVTTKIAGYLLVGLVGLGIGYFLGREHIKYEVRQTMRAAADEMRESLAGAFEGTREEDPVMATASVSPRSQEPSPPPTPTPAVEQAQPAPEPNAEPTVDWVLAETPVKLGDVEVRVASATVGKVALTEFGEEGKKSVDTFLSITLDIKNLSETKKLNYKTWGAGAMFSGPNASLNDNFENHYKAVTFGVTKEISGSVSNSSVYPGKSITDIIVFEEPIEKAEYLNLELSADQIGGEGVFRIRIPTSMVQREVI